MSKFEYEITEHPAGEFEKLVYFCSEAGECSLEEVPKNQIEILENILNDMGAKGWELVQLSFTKDGIIAFWKRPL